MLIQKKLLPVLSIFLISFNCFSQKKADTAIAVHYQTNDFDVAIFPSDKSKNQFTPTKQDVDKAELALKTHLKDLDTGHMDKMNEEVIKSKMNNYQRQYFGCIATNGHKILYINAFWKDHEFDNWLKQRIIVEDGASHYWHIEFDLNSGKLSELWANGPG